MEGCRCIFLVDSQRPLTTNYQICTTFERYIRFWKHMKTQEATKQSSECHSEIVGHQSEVHFFWYTWQSARLSGFSEDNSWQNFWFAWCVCALRTLPFMRFCKLLEKRITQWAHLIYTRLSQRSRFNLEVIDAKVIKTFTCNINTKLAS